MAKERREEPKYEDASKEWKKNLERNEAFYYAFLMKKGDNGKEGQANGLFASLWNLRTNIGLEGMLEVLETQGIQSIQGNNGLNANYSLENVIGESSKNFQQSLFELKVEDIVKYVKDRIPDYKPEVSYADKKLIELMKDEASDEERAYGQYLISQVQTAVMAKVTPLAYKERAMRETRIYRAAKAQPQPAA